MIELRPYQLQWGRGLSPTETCPHKGSRALQNAASMGPRAFAHGDPVLCRKRNSTTGRFNGAAGFRPRRPRIL